MKLTIFSDIHGRHREVEQADYIDDSDVLICCGDFMRTGTLDELAEFNEWLGTLPQRDKIIIAGNHDHCLESQREEAVKLITNAHYLENSALVIDDIKFWGSPFCPSLRDTTFGKLQHRMWSVWGQMPNDTDVLITHTPPRGVFDFSESRGGAHVGCTALINCVLAIQPKVHCFGHIHEGGGKYEENFNGTIFANAAILDKKYKVANKPIKIEMTKNEK